MTKNNKDQMTQINRSHDQKNPDHMTK